MRTYMSDSEYLKAKEVAKLFGVNPRTITRWIEAGYLPGSFRQNPRVNNSTYLVPKEAIEKFKKEQNATRKD